MTSFSERAVAGDAIGVLRSALINGALWATAIAWSNAIREVTRALLPSATGEVVLAELLAACLTTALGVLIALIAARRDWCRRRAREEPPPLPPPRQLGPLRR